MTYVATARYENEKVWEVQEEFDSKEEAEKTIEYLKNFMLSDAKWEIKPKKEAHMA
ncbi:MAG: hypothetical protein ACQEWR_22430 [Bacillota bacterium]